MKFIQSLFPFPCLIIVSTTMGNSFLLSSFAAGKSPYPNNQDNRPPRTTRHQPLISQPPHRFTEAPAVRNNLDSGAERPHRFTEAAPFHRSCRKKQPGWRRQTTTPFCRSCRKKQPGRRHRTTAPFHRSCRKKQPGQQH
jgi:hypothetical protein